MTEQEISVDCVYISEKHTEELYPDTVPICDPPWRTALTRSIVEDDGADETEAVCPYNPLMGIVQKSNEVG